MHPPRAFYLHQCFGVSQADSQSIMEGNEHALEAVLGADKIVPAADKKTPTTASSHNFSVAQSSFFEKLPKRRILVR